MLSSLVYNWLLGGADPTVGLRLFMDYTDPNKSIANIVSKNPEKHLQLMKTALFRKADIPLDFQVNKAHIESKAAVIAKTQESNRKEQYRVRTQWPFLADPDCPHELKLLISDKITIYSNCVKTYESLSDAKENELCDKLRILVTNFVDNHRIYQELQHYKKTKTTLGEHPIFAQIKRIKDLRNLNTMELFKKKKNIENNLWRTKAKLKKEKREDLVRQRNEKIKELQMQLAEVNRLLA
ncbi:hypothetical protein QE382_002147 [Sphingobacterium zeae]|uniref:Uncharacterized protein n=1 Tax=Sphingobacterium zeae TaxID=1776859 RepID=A0ABU0U7F8_9SPHI|nr:hypothetical protein [Sphingobacterium zeae]MDQ1150163.1 hypothetical protein [Sphingobacterium zeae]